MRGRPKRVIAMLRSCSLLLLLLGACARQATPIMASQIAERANASTLSAYLGQRDASAAVCDGVGRRLRGLPWLARRTSSRRVRPRLALPCEGRLDAPTLRPPASGSIDTVGGTTATDPIARRAIPILPGAHPCDGG